MLFRGTIASTRKAHCFLQQRIALCTVSSFPASSDFNQLKKLGHRDWLSPNEVLTIIRNLKDPNSVVTVLNQYSKRKDYRPNEALYSLSIDILAQAKMFDAIEDVMGRIRNEKGCRLSDAFFYNVIKIYGNMAGRVNRAVETLFDMPTRYNVLPSVKSFNFVLNLLVVSKMYDVVHEVYMAAPRLGVEIDACCLNILVKGLCENGKVSYAHQLLDEFPKQRCSPNVRSFSTLMHGLIKQGKMEDAFRVLDRMEKEGVFPDTITFNILISGLRKIGRIEEGMELLERMKLKGCDPNDSSYQEVLYGLLEKERFMEAKGLMAQMLSKRMNPSFRSYKLVIAGLCKEKSFDEVDWILKQMMYQDFVPKMGMWKTIIRNLFSDRTRLKDIVGDSLVRVLGEGELRTSEVEPEDC